MCDHKICQICGDKAIGRNFFAITCESCKAFFRRTALKNKPLECPSDGKCMITSKTRQLCKKCRLEKCFTVGMKKELIRSHEENKLRYLEVIENKRKQQMIQNTDSLDSSDSTNSCVSLTTQTVNENDFITELIESTLNISDDQLSEQIMDIEMTINTLKNFQTYDEVVLKCQQMSVSPVFRVIPDYEGWKELEFKRISELLGITGYSNLCFTDQLALIKYGGVELLAMHYLMCYDCETDNFKLNVDDETSVLVDIYQFEIKSAPNDLLVKVWPELESDPVIRNLFIS
ncbi:unnamed protein product [Oppiella nova]|uniref:Nuclear receptor domain-containing protein n=1 Tax=Oppiella nova TaxID=334625 RepID=A0A7R9QAR1_9ACAR|nr:unnamed protein product [Oppiella nova]CAG2162124.1 unnamed protein product [Oppiella nova]